jgi:L-ascorbate metabolism protein UlaG (beta-lactamase superfamily)
MTMGGARIQFVGHATVRIELDGVRLITDPVLRDRVAHLRRTAPIDVAAPGAVDAVLISHAHLDHLDLPSLRRIGRRVAIVVPRGLGRLLRRRRFENVLERDVGERVRIGVLDVEATPAEHDGSRRLFGGHAGAIGFAVLGSRRVLFFGDTDLFPEMDGLVDGLDLALVPIWGWGPTLGRHKHLDPARAAEALRRLRPRVAVPIHWGTFHPVYTGLRGPPSFLSDPAGAFVAAAAVAAPDVDVRVLRPGEETWV